MFVLYYSGQPDFAPVQPAHPLGTIGEIFDFIGDVGIFNIILIYIVIRTLFAFMMLKDELLNHWNVLIQGLSYSPKDFYKQLEEELKEQGLEGFKITPKKHFEGNILSGRREYAVVSWDTYKYTVCAAPFCKSFFVSYRSLHKMEVGRFVVSRIPWIGKGLAGILFPLTYYKEDVINMFHAAMHNAILKVVDDISNEKGIEKIPESQRIPKVRDIFER